MISKKVSPTHRLVMMSILIASSIILSRFLSIPGWNFKIGFAFVPIVLAAILLGPIPAAIVAAVADYLGAILFPIASYFPGFTFTAFIVGAIYGVFLYKKQTMKNIVFAVITTELLGSLCLNTLWISVLFGTPFWALLPTRLIQVLVMTAVEVIVIRAMVGYVPYLKQAQNA